VLAKIDRAWRLFGTGFSFFVFGVGGLVLPIFVVPVLYCLPGDALTRERRVQITIHYMFRMYIEMMRFLGVLTYQIDGIEKLKQARLILANHPSLLDVVFLISMVPNASCVVKGRLTRNFFIRGSIKASGYIINEEAGDVVTAATRVFDNGQALIIFPEGTRTTPSKPLQFKRGAANIAVRTVSDITPVLIYCTPTTLTRNEHWYQVPSKRVHFRIVVRDQLAIEQYVKNPRPSRGARNLTSDLTEYFNREIESNG
jgi:1-acyl-sn-glycerol-3-phosphate acyltransferase